MPRQGWLFGKAPEPDPGRQPDPARVAPAALRESHRTVAQKLPASLRFGTCSWSFPGWEGLVYKDQHSQRDLARGGLAAYARHPLLRAVCIDRGFYAPVPVGDLAAYAAATPRDFRFLLKAASDLTTPYLRTRDGKRGPTSPHYLDADWATTMVVEPFREGLGAKGGAVLLQFPPQGNDVTAEPERFADALAAFLGALPPGPCYAVELRDAKLLSQRYVEALRSAGARHCYNVHPTMPPLARQRAVADTLPPGPVVARWMLRAGLHYEQARSRFAPFDAIVDRDDASRQALVRLCLDGIRGGQPVVVVANNKAEGSAPLSVFAVAAQVAELLGRSS